jgi:hypothetical protein
MEEPKHPKIEGVYRHFKGEERLYRVKRIARDCDNPEKKVVVYENLYEGDFPKGTCWIRELEEFMGFKELNGEKIKRFTLIE